MSEWINVKDRLPEEGEEVLCWDGMSIYSLSLTFELKFHKEMLKIKPPYIPNYKKLPTHWMSLPKPPESKNHE